MRTTSVARRYAKATFEVAQEAEATELWQEVLRELASVLSDGQLMESLGNPGVSAEQKLGAIQSAFPDMPMPIANLVRLLLERHRLAILPGISAAFDEYLDEMMGLVDAQVVSARALGPDEVSAIQEHLNKRTGKTVRISTSVDPGIIGGVVMRVGDELIDGSVLTRLERLRQRLA